MSLFQKSVENKYLNELDSNLIDNKYSAFKEYFANPLIQENIRNSKEEQFQEGFLRELFVSIFGYTLNPHPEFNLTTELKNVVNSKKADGAILKGEDAIAVIELKGTDTTDLDKIEAQAFGYKNHHPKCVYVITSNFEKLRFYIQNAVDHIDFDLFNLTREKFSLMWLCLAKDNLLNGLPQKIKELSLLKEENITKKLYSDYSKFREAIYNNLVKNNPETDKLLLFKKTQKLLDRFLFIFFAEDRLLLPPNSISQIVKQWTTLKDELDEYVPLYDRFKKYFGYMNTGYKSKKYDIYAYNGGLFEPDEILDNISIDDNILQKHTLALSQYDFETDVDVNILGHIFEHSLGEIENVQAEIKGEKIDNKKTKRKKDGIFYTPKYITKYIVENTVGKLCEEKRIELDIVDEEYAKGRKNRKKDTIKALDDKLTEYRKWLLSLTILDPACGSGAFLNQALDFLITEHRKIDELRSNLLEEGLVFSDITTDILEKNIYGVDINEESVEIAKLSLWLRTAQKGRKLNSLSNNIKCGNSLIDDPEVAGDKAFNWQNEFPEIFANGGFDVVIGNPPYVVIDPEKLINYSLVKGNYNTYVAFFELSLSIIREKGRIGYIIPNTWFSGDNFEDFRKHLIEFHQIEEIIQLPYDIFEAYVDTSICIVNKWECNYLTKYYKYDIRDFQNSIDINKLNKIQSKEWLKYGKIFLNNNLLKIGDKVWFSSTNIKLGAISKINRGSLPPKENEKSNIKTKYYNLEWFDNQVFRYVIRGKNKLKYISYENLRENKPLHLFKTKKILARQLMSRQFRMNLTLVNNEFAFKKNLYAIYDISDQFFPEYILSVLNSKLFSYVQVNFNTSLQRDDFPSFSLNDFKNFSIPSVSKKNQQPFIEKADILLSLNKELQTVKSNFFSSLKEDKGFEKITRKLENFNELEYDSFKKELAKQNVKISLGNENNEWREYFNSTKQKADELQRKIDQTDKEIDQMVYELYGLSEEEIKVVEETIG